LRLLIRSRHARWQDPRPGFAQVAPGTVVVGLLVVPVVVVTDVVDVVVASATVDEDVDVVVDDVVVVGGIVSVQLPQAFATVFCWDVLSGSWHAGQSVLRLRNVCWRQARIAIRRTDLHFRTQPKVIVQRPPPVERQRGLLGMASIHVLNSAVAVSTQLP
jgi:hypothetical protein